MAKDYKNNDLAGSDGPDDPHGDVGEGHEPVGGGGGGGPDEAQGTDYHTTRSNNTSVSDGDLVGDGSGDGKVPTKSGGDGIKSIRFKSSGGEGSGGSNVPTKSGHGEGSRFTRSYPRGGGGKGPGIVRKGVGKTLGLAKTMIMTAVLISVAGAGVDVYQTYNDAIAIDLEEHITDADFELSEDKSEISGSVGFDIPQMGTFEKSIIASVHITVLESNPTTDGDYEFEYTLGSGEHFYDFTLDDLDPVTVEKIEAGQPLDIEYSGTISVTYLGIEIPSITMDIPLTTTIVETA